MSKRKNISIINPEGTVVDLPNVALGCMPKLSTPEGIVHHVAQVESKKRDDLKEEDAWPRTYKIILFNGEEQEIKIGAKKTLQFYIDKDI
jgi:hypothetical protein